MLWWYPKLYQHSFAAMLWTWHSGDTVGDDQGLAAAMEWGFLKITHKRRRWQAWNVGIGCHGKGGITEAKRWCGKSMELLDLLPAPLQDAYRERLLAGFQKLG